MTTAEAAHSISMYNNRATSYDASTGGWHVELGRDFITWVKPEPGDAVLDLACGTGLVSLPAAEAVGNSGLVVGVDISPGMLAEARKKKHNPASASIYWIEHDITDLNNIKAVQDVVSSRGGFDIITCCSAFVLLPDAHHQIITHWASLLKQGGKMIIDVPTGDRGLQYMFTVDLRQAVGSPMPYRRDWIKDIHSLEKLYQDAGLEIDQSLRTRSYIGEKWYDGNEREEVFNAQLKTYPSFEHDGTVEQARQAFKKLWEDSLKDNGKFWDGHPLYVTIGRKP